MAHRRIAAVKSSLGRTTFRARARRGAAAAVAVLIVGVAGGCSQASPAVVAYVDGTEITQTQLDQAVSSVEGTLEAGQTVAKPAVVNALIHGQLATEVARRQGFTFTEVDRAAALEANGLTALLAQEDGREFANAVADQAILLSVMGSEAYVQAIAGADVTVNPRFGQLDPQTHQILEGSSGSLIKPATGQ